MSWGSFFEFELKFVEYGLPIATGTRVGTDDGDNMQMQLLRHERTQLPGANGRAAPVSGYLTSITLMRDGFRIFVRHNKERSNESDRYICQLGPNRREGSSVQN